MAVVETCVPESLPCVEGVLRSPDVLPAVFAAVGWRVLDGPHPFGLGDVLTVGPAAAAVDADNVAVTLTSTVPTPGALRWTGADLTLAVELHAAGPNTAVTASLTGSAEVPCGVLPALAGLLAEQASALADRPVVVATALVADGRLLAAQRSKPPELAGRWELPGGSVEPGETEPDAVVREIEEELHAQVRVVDRIGPDVPLPTRVLRVYSAELLPTSPDPVALEHQALRWVGPDELAEIDWLPADRLVLPELRDLLSGRGLPTPDGGVTRR